MPTTPSSLAVLGTQAAEKENYKNSPGDPNNHGTIAYAAGLVGFWLAIGALFVFTIDVSRNLLLQ